MKEKELPFDRSKHVIYTKSVKKCVQKLHACLIREGTCVTSECCDYCIVGDRNSLVAAYDLVKAENSLMLSVKK